MRRHGSMNHIYRLIWSQVHNTWIAVAATTRGQGKEARCRLIAAALSLSAVSVEGAPVGGEVVHGVAGIAQSGVTTTVTQTTPNLSLNWQSFNIGATETVNFVQPSAAAIAVNRILDPHGTRILGRLNANGQVYLINPNGVLFGRDAQVNVGGLVASTLELNDATLSGNARSFSGDGSGSVVNQGTIIATDGGYVALLGNRVSNQGTISAQLGTVALGAGSAATLNFNGNSLVHMQVDQSVLNSVADNGGLVRADGGMVLMNAGAEDALLASVVNNTGVIEARTVENRGGTIILLGGMDAGTVNVGGTLDASAPDGGDGGFIETSAAHVNVADDANITTAAPSSLAGTWLIDPFDFTIAATGGSMTGATLSTSLVSGNVLIQSTSGTIGTAGNVNVNDVVAWSANQLTLNAQGNININADLNGSGSASLALEYGQGAVAAGNLSETIVHAAVNLPAGNNFSTRLGSDGVVKNYTVLTSLGAAGSTTGTDLQGINADVTANYALGGNIDAAATSGWNANAGFAPLGNENEFTGTFDGLGHTVSGLTINLATANVGLFGVTGAGAAIRNIGLVGGSVTGAAGTGALVGNNGPGNPVSNSYSTASVSGAADTGGLVGTNTTGAITNSYATGNVSGAAGTGGLVGSNTSGAINTSYATGNVSGAAGTGGLVGSNTSGSVSDSYATGNVVSSGAGTGGLIGSSTSGLISNTYATGSVTSAGAGIGGLIGSGTPGAVSNSYWDAVTSGQAISPGGGEGRNSVELQQQSNFYGWDFDSIWTIYERNANPWLRSLMTPLTVTANNQSAPYNGLAYSGGNGVTYSTPVNGVLAGTLTYGGTAQGAINAGSYLIAPSGLQSNQQYLITFANGGLTVDRAHLTVTAVNNDRLYGQVNPTLGTTLSGFVNGETAVTAAGFGGSGSASTAANPSTDVGTAIITAAAGSLAATNYDFTNFVNGALTINPAHLTVTAVNNDRLYGQVNPTLSTTLSGFVNGETAVTAAGFSGSSSAITAANAATNVGIAIIAADAGTLAATNYDFINLVNGTLTINPAQLSMSTNAAGRTYDATTDANVTLGALVGLVGLETLGVTATGTFDDKDVGIGKDVSVVYTLSDGAIGGLASNYRLADASLSADITAANLAVTGVTASDKVYDGTTAATLGGTAAVSAIATDVVRVGIGSGVFDDRNVGTDKAVIVSGFTLSGADAGNYTIAQPSGLTANITPLTTAPAPTPITPITPITPVAPVMPVMPTLPPTTLPTTPPTIPPRALLDGVAQLEADVLKSEGTASAEIDLSPANTEEARACAPGNSDYRDCLVVSIDGTSGPRLQIVNGGLRLPVTSPIDRAKRVNE